VSCALFVHAHPDDETIATGATMAGLAAAGVDVALVTCTRGEEGEVIPPALCYLEDDRDHGLAPFRVGELRRALVELGVEKHWYLDDLASAEAGHPVHYRDSGMVGTPPNADSRAFTLAPVDAAARALARLVERLQPAALVTYDPEGGYGHPDHVQAHRVAMRAVELSAWPVPKVYWIAVPRSVAVVSEGMTASTSVAIDDELVTTAVGGSAFLDRKIAAMRAHATQIEVDPPRFALSNGIWQQIASTEYYRLVAGAPSPPYDANGREMHLL
jgi:N-acetyl-1-D-myo-inositol-2-amino-2-deoxy-alpha-D-glucopyranoside deacetylase